MAQHPFLKSIRPVNLLSFGPNTEEIELRPLNILIGPNGCGKSNFVDMIGLLSRLPDKDPWSGVIQTGGAREWIWKGKKAGESISSLTVTSGDRGIGSMFSGSELNPLFYSVSLRGSDGGFIVLGERFLEFEPDEDPTIANPDAFVREEGRGSDTPWQRGFVVKGPRSDVEQPEIPPGRSCLSVIGSTPYFVTFWPRMPEFAKQIGSIASYRNWTFGEKAESRALQPVGLDSYRLAADSSNLAQVLKAMRDRGDSSVFERLIELLRTFYEPIKDVDTELVGTHLRIMIKEEGLGSRTPAERLSDGTLRWLMLLIVLLDPTPPPVICIDEPDLGLHPDIIPTLADLLKDASTRTQLIVTTHSQMLVECFSDDPEAICVCEKIDGATRIERLDKDRLKVWLEDYSLGQLWASGEIGGNRW
jgi:predicted ATPase